MSSRFSEIKKKGNQWHHHQTTTTTVAVILNLSCQLLTLHRVDEVSVLAPDLPPETRVVVVLQVGRTEPRATFLPITLLLVSRPRAGRTVLPRRFAIAARSAPLHLWSDSKQTAGDTVKPESSVDTHFCYCVWITGGQHQDKNWETKWPRAGLEVEELLWQPKTVDQWRYQSATLVPSQISDTRVKDYGFRLNKKRNKAVKIHEYTNVIYTCWQTTSVIISSLTRQLPLATEEYWYYMISRKRKLARRY